MLPVTTAGPTSAAPETMDASRDTIARTSRTDQSRVDRAAIDTLRLLTADAVVVSNSGHLGLPLGMAPAAWILWSRFLRIDPADPTWPDRDRFVLSAGHGSMLLYGLLHLSGHDLPIEELQAFRQWGSRTPGHPEHGVTPGVETTTGPLGQGLGNAVGMALAERMLAARYGDGDIVDHRTWVIASDGDLMEGISHEACSLAGHLRLGRLGVLYDDNAITIDGATSRSCSDDADMRFRSYGWHVVVVDDGTDLDAIEAALRAAMEDDRPSLVRIRTRIGEGAPDVVGTAAAHGAGVDAAQVRAMKVALGRDPDEDFAVPDDVRRHGWRIRERGHSMHEQWQQRFAAWETANPDTADGWHRAHAAAMPHDLDKFLPTFEPGTSVATRAASGDVLAAIHDVLPELVGGSADLAGSNNTDGVATTAVTAQDQRGARIDFGIREHAMAAVGNGIALHGGLRAYTATFAVFSDYARPSIRLAALMGLPVVFILTHDSIGVGEDGPTHQPIEHLAALRAIPGLAVLRPADANETVAAWRMALERTDGPTALLLSRQGLPVLDPAGIDTMDTVGARVVHEPHTTPDVVVVATGSEVSAAIEAADTLAGAGTPLAVRVVSMPWRERFLALDATSAAALVPRDRPCVVVEAGVRQGWEGLAGTSGDIVALDDFGASAPGVALQQQFSLDASGIAAVVRDTHDRYVAVRASGGGPPSS